LDGIQRATPRTVPGADQSRVVSAEEALTMPPVSAGTPVLVVDDLGGYAGVGVAEYFLALGCPVLHVTGNPVLDADLAASSQWEPAMKRLHARPGYAARTRSALVSLTASTATLEGLDTGAQDEVPAGLVLLLTAYQPERALYDALGSAPRARAILLGDAFLPSGLQAAVSGAYECASRLQVPARRAP
jgi:NADPH-dependent 2,4-dienoyl-CoA reductase/sulfur reductase-like enzyme